MQNWEEKIFDNFAKLKRGYDLPEKNIIHGEYPIIASTSVKDYHKTYKVKPPCVVTGRSGSLGTVQYINKKCWPLNTTLYVKEFKGNLPKFVYYFLQTMHLENYNSGAGVPTLNQNHLHKLKIKTPSLPIQKKIAAVLSTCDDLIENNNRRMAILEKMAELIYREWFVRMRFPGHEKVKFKKGVPEGWEMKKIEDLCIKITDGSHFSPKESSSGYPMASVKDMEEHSFNFTSVKRISESDYIQLVKSDCKPLFNDILIAKDGSYLKNVFLCLEEIEMTILSSIAILRPNLNEIDPFYFTYYLKQPFIKAAMSNYVTGAALPRIILDDFKKISLLIAPTKIQNNFSEIAKELIGKIHILLKTNTGLQRSRNLLLSRLISGKLSIENLDIKFPKSMEDAGA